MSDAQASIGAHRPYDRRNWRDVFYTSRDGLRLYARHYPAPATGRRAVVCLPGLTRNVRDFHILASYLSDPALDTARDVYAVDYRGRGRSAYDPVWRNYTMQVETLDVLDFMTLSGQRDAAIIGTSRGGLIAMIMAALRPSTVGAVVLNDIGPVIEREGLARIIAYTGRVPLPTTWAEAARLVQEMNGPYFPAIADEEWVDVARQWFDDVNGEPVHGYDQNLGKAVTLLDGTIPELWPQFEGLANVPTLAIRGELSDILSERTLDTMRVRHPRLDTVLVRRQGHAPLLRERPILEAIADFLAKADAMAMTTSHSPVHSISAA